MIARAEQFTPLGHPAGNRVGSQQQRGLRHGVDQLPLHRIVVGNRAEPVGPLGDQIRRCVADEPEESEGGLDVVRCRAPVPSGRAAAGQHRHADDDVLRRFTRPTTGADPQTGGPGEGRIPGRGRAAKSFAPGWRGTACSAGRVVDQGPGTSNCSDGRT